jgi:hypothetical protein
MNLNSVHGTISGNTIKNSGYPGDIGLNGQCGILLAAGNNNVTVQNNTFELLNRPGILLWPYDGAAIFGGTLNVTQNLFKDIPSNGGRGAFYAPAGVILSGVNLFSNAFVNNTLDLRNLTTSALSAANNYFDGCPAVTSNVTYFPYFTIVEGIPGEYEFAGPISNINAEATVSTICAGSSTTVYATGGSDYVWDNGLGLGSSKVVFPVTNPTTYNVTGKDANGCTGAFDAVIIGVNAAPTVLINGSASGSSTIPSATLVTLTASGATSYLWSTGETTTAINVYPTYATTYSVTGTTGTCSGTATHTVTPITVSAGPNQFICSGNMTTLTASVTGATPSAYLWAPGGETTDHIDITPGSTTVYTLTVTVGGSTPHTHVTVFVNSKPVANAGADITIASGGTGTLTGSASSGTAPYTYAWTGFEFAAATKTIHPSAAGDYSLVVTDAFGCSSLADVAHVTVAAGGYTVSGNVSYYNTLNPQMHNVTVTLDQGGAALYTAVTPASGNGDYQFIGVANGTYNVKFSLTTAWGGVTSADIIAIQNHYKSVGAVPLIGLKRLAADVVDNSTSALVILNDRNAVNNKRLYPNNPAYNFATGNWVFVKEANVLTNTAPYTFANAAGATNITITVGGSAVTQNFKSLCYGDVDASYSGYKILELQGSVVDVDAIDGLSFKNYPNPFNQNTMLSYSMPVEGNVTIDIYNLTGSRVARIENGNQTEGEYTCNWDARNMPNGLYIAMIVVKTSDDVLRQQVKMLLNK